MADDRKETGGGGGSIVVPLLLLLVLGGGVGFGYGLLMGGAGKSDASHSMPADGASLSVKEASSASEVKTRGGPDWQKEELLPLSPIVVRMKDSQGKWVRLEGSVAFLRSSHTDRSAVATQLGEDLMLLLGSTSVENIASPTGLEFLRDDMNEIVQVRTSGQATRFILKSLVME